MTWRQRKGFAGLGGCPCWQLEQNVIKSERWRLALGSALDSEGREGRQEEQGAAARREQLARIVVDAGLHVHRALGPGLLESVYEQCLSHELTLRGVALARQVTAPVPYKGIVLEGGYRMDLLVEDQIIIEVKSVEAHSRLHEAQLRTYLRLSSRQLGFLMNFNVVLFKDGLRRINV